MADYTAAVLGAASPSATTQGTTANVISTEGGVLY
jgi:hypothetical protein